MSLFKCSKCGGIENTACCWDSKKEIVFELSENNKFPNMGLMDMQGHGDEFKFNGVVWKAKDEIMMLCSECNVGNWHGEWTKEYSTVEEDIVASYSEYAFTTKFDHEYGLFKKDVIYIPNSHNNELNIVYDILHTIYRKETGLSKLDTLEESEYPQYKLLYKIMLEEGNNLDLENLETYAWLNYLEKPIREITDMKEFSELVFKLLPNKDNSGNGIELTIFGLMLYLLKNDKCTTVTEFYEHANLSESIKNYRDTVKTNAHGQGIKEVDDIMKSLGKRFGMSYNKKHWKETQSQEDRDAKLKAAVEKRIRKGKL